MPVLTEHRPLLPVISDRVEMCACPNCYTRYPCNSTCPNC